MEVIHRLDLKRYGHIAAWNKSIAYPTREVYRRAYRQCRKGDNPAAWSGSEQYIAIARRACASYRATLEETIEQTWRVYRTAERRPDAAMSRDWHRHRLAIIASVRSAVFA